MRGGLRIGRREAACERGVHAAGTGERAVRLQISGGEEERTANMRHMFVTPEVSQSSGWLKAYAFCRGSQAGHTVRGGLRGPGGGRPRVSAAQRVQGGSAQLQIVGAGRGEQRTLNMWFMLVTLEVSHSSGAG